MTTINNTLRSKQFAQIIDVLCEGPIVGLVNGAQSIFYNETPFQNPDGTFNFRDTGIQERKGYRRQDPFDGVDGIEFEVGVNAEVKFGIPVIRTLSTPNVDSARVTISIPALTDQNQSNGDINGAAVHVFIQTRGIDGVWRDMVSDVINGTTTSKYTKSYKFELVGAGPWDIRVTRINADSDRVSLNNKTVFESFTGIVSEKFIMPNTAAVYSRFDSEIFGSVPSRAFEIKGQIIEVPSNYNPVTRAYTGLWDGTFKEAWSDNPAWCFRDIMTKKRYGLGKFIDTSQVDKWALYSIAKYCDQLVPDGKGGMEPRFTCNLYLQTQEEAYKVVQNLASLFRAITYWGTGSVIPSQDRPTDPIQIFTNANVAGGEFSYTGSSLKQRHTVALVSWNDPTDFYRQKIEYVEDAAGVQERGIIELPVTGFGCASQGQAHRLGKWMLATEKYADDVINFKTGLDGCVVYPGAVFQTSDVTRAGKRYGGRIISATTSVVQIDHPVEVEAGKSYQLSCMLSDGSMVTTNVVNFVASGETDTIGLQTAMSSAPQEGAVWVLADVTTLVPQLWRVISAKESDDGLSVDISALLYVPDLYDSVETGIEIQQRPISVINTKPAMPTNLAVIVSQYTVDGQVSGLRATLSWTSTEIRFRVAWRRKDGLWQTEEVLDRSINIDNLSNDEYDFTVVAINRLGRESDPASLSQTVVPNAATLAAPTGLALEGAFTANAVKFKWNPVAGATAYEIQIERALNGTVVRTQVIGNVTRFEYSANDIKADGGPFREINFKVRAKGNFNAVSPYANIGAGNPQVTALTGIKLESGVKSLFFSCDRPTDDDFAGIEVHISETANFTPSPATLYYDGNDTRVTITTLDKTKVYYLKAGGYDSYGKDGIIFSSSLTATVLGNAPDLDSITEGMIKSGALTMTKFATDIQPIGIVSELPNPVGYTGPVLVTLTTTGKLWRLNNGAWTSELGETTISPGMISATELSDALKEKIAHIQVLTDQIVELEEDIEYLESSSGIANAAVRVAYASKSVADQSLAEYSLTLTSALNGNQASIEQVSTTQNGVFAQVYTKIDVNGHVAGYGLVNDGKNGTPVSAFAVNVDAFQIGGTGIAATPMFQVSTKAGSQYIKLDGVKIIDGTIYSDAIATDAVIAGKIAAGAVKAREIDAGAITADKLYIRAQGAALNVDPYLTDITAWTTTASIVTVSNGYVGSTVMRSRNGVYDPVVAKERVPFDPTRRYRVRTWARKVGTGSPSISIGVRCYDVSGNIISNNNSDWFPPDSLGFVPNTIFGEVLGLLNVAGFMLPASAKTFSLVAQLNLGAVAGNYIEIQDFRIEEQLMGTLIADGAVTTNKLFASAVTADKIKANEITGDKLIAEAITSREIKVDAILAKHIKAGEITADKIDGKGLVIRDAAGIPILGGGTYLTTDFIDGLGDLATKNGLSAAEIAGLGKLAIKDSISAAAGSTDIAGLGDLARKNSVSAAAGSTEVTGLGALARKDKITWGANDVLNMPTLGRFASVEQADWNWIVANKPEFTAFATLSKILAENIDQYIGAAAIDTAYIRNAAIKSALIADLEVGTIKIANNAITVPTYVEGNGGASGFPTLGPGQSAYAASFPITFPYPVTIAAIATWQASQPGGGTNTGIEIAVNGNVFVSQSDSAPGGLSTSHVSSGKATLGAGSYTFTIKFTNDYSAGVWSLLNWSVTLLGVMK